MSAAIGKTKPGALFFFPHAIRFAPGSYEIELPVNILKAAPDSTPTTPALAFELNKNCSRIYTLSELQSPKTTLTLKCSDPGYGTPRLTWAGKVGVSVEKLVIRRIEEQL